MGRLGSLEYLLKNLWSWREVKNKVIFIFFFQIRNKSNEYFLTTELAIHQLQRMEENLVKELMLTKMSAI